MKNKLGDLNDHLFAQMERLSDESMGDEQLTKELARAKGMVSVSEQIVDNAGLQMTAAKLYAEYGDQIVPHLPAVGRTKQTQNVIQ